MSLIDLTPYLQNKLSIQPIEFERKTFWLKKANPPHPSLRYKLLGLLAKWFNSPLLVPIPKPGGNESVAIETERLQNLKKLGVNVPEVIQNGEDHLLISSMGSDLRKLLKQADNNERRHELFHLGLNGIFELHQKKTYLSQAFSRNMTLNENDEIGFIDFEDDPITCLTLEQAQARDLLLYFISSVYFLDGDKIAAIKLINDKLAAYDKNICLILWKTIKSFLWITRMKPRKILGRDFLRIRATLIILAKVNWPE